MGKFEDLLVAVAHSPAMLVYLDNQQSIGPHSVAAMRAAGSSGQKKSAPGLNENYARELMELHTLGVNGGYTQQDVVELAKVLTGWGTETKRQGYGFEFGFEFNERRHEPGEKVVLGHRIQENGTGEHGEAEGMEVLHLLAMSPATARFLSTKLATEFVSDTPPKSLVDRMRQHADSAFERARHLGRQRHRAKWSLLSAPAFVFGLQCAIQPSVFGRLDARRARLHIILRIEVRARHIRRARCMHNREMLPVPQRLQTRHRRMQSEKSIQIDNLLLRNSNRRPHLEIRRLGVWDDNIQPICRPALKDHHQLLPAHTGCGRLRHHRARQEARYRRRPHQSQRSVLQESSTRSHRLHMSPLH
jgi:Protein of unknown function (DUF1800)